MANNHFVSVYLCIVFMVFVFPSFQWSSKVKFGLSARKTYDTTDWRHMTSQTMLDKSNFGNTGNKELVINNNLWLTKFSLYLIPPLTHICLTLPMLDSLQWSHYYSTGYPNIFIFRSFVSGIKTITGTETEPNFQWNRNQSASLDSRAPRQIAFCY